jgi:dihydroorotase
MMTFDRVIRHGRVVTPNGIETVDIGISAGKILKIGAIPAGAGAEDFDARGLTVLPGVIDTQVHFREPGLEHKEDLESGSRAAVLGGVTAVFEMPNTKPNTDSADAVADKLRRAHHRMHCDHAFYAGATTENAAILGDLERLPGVCGIKIFMGASTGSLLVADDAHLTQCLTHTRRRVAIHAEDEERMQARKHLAVAGDWSSHAVARDAESARLATQRILAIARTTHARLHVLHITTGEEVDLLAANKDIATFEILPQHLTLHAPDCYERLKGFAQMNPPIRGIEHQTALWRAVNEGIVDIIGTDHAPHTRAEKEQPYPASPSGLTGVQTLVPILLTHVNAGKLTLERFVDLVCHGPQRVFGIANKGRIAVGYDADFTVVDMQAKRTITHAQQASRVGWTPYDGFEATAWPMATIVRGHIVMRDDEVITPSMGEPIKFWETV